MGKGSSENLMRPFEQDWLWALHVRKKELQEQIKGLEESKYKTAIRQEIDLIQRQIEEMDRVRALRRQAILREITPMFERLCRVYRSAFLYWHSMSEEEKEKEKNEIHLNNLNYAKQTLKYAHKLLWGFANDYFISYNDLLYILEHNHERNSPLSFMSEDDDLLLIRKQVRASSVDPAFLISSNIRLGEFYIDEIFPTYDIYPEIIYKLPPPEGPICHLRNMPSFLPDPNYKAPVQTIRKEVLDLSFSIENVLNGFVIAMGVAFIAIGIVSAVMSFGIGTPLAIVGIEMGLGMILGSTGLGTVATGVGYYMWPRMVKDVPVKHKRDIEFKQFKPRLEAIQKAAANSNKTSRFTSCIPSIK